MATNEQTCECGEITGENCAAADRNEATVEVLFLRQCDRDQARRTSNAEGMALHLHLCESCAVALDDAQINACEHGTLNPHRDDCREPDLLRGEIVCKWDATEQITRTEPHRDGSGTVIGLDCYAGGLLVGFAAPEDNCGDGTVRIDGSVYGTPFGTMERLAAIGDDLAAVTE